MPRRGSPDSLCLRCRIGALAARRRVRRQHHGAQQGHRRPPGGAALLRALQRLPLAGGGERVRLEAGGSDPCQGGERTNGPNFNIRKEKRDDVLFAIRNGGFSGAIMPANVVVGHNAQLVADFVSKYSGSKPSQGQSNPGIKNQP